MICFTVQFNPLGLGITSVIIVPDIDTDNDGSHESFTATAGDANAVDMDAGTFGSVMELLSTLPTDVLEAAYRHHPVGHIATNTVGRTATTTLETTRPQLIGSASKSNPSNNIVTEARTPSAKPTMESLASAKTTAPSTPIKQNQSSAASTTDSNITRSTLSKVSDLPYMVTPLVPMLLPVSKPLPRLLPLPLVLMSQLSEGKLTLLFVALGLHTSSPPKSAMLWGTEQGPFWSF